MFFLCPPGRTETAVRVAAGALLMRRRFVEFAGWLVVLGWGGHRRSDTPANRSTDNGAIPSPELIPNGGTDSATYHHQARHPPWSGPLLPLSQKLDSTRCLRHGAVLVPRMQIPENL